MLARELHRGAWGSVQQKLGRLGDLLEDGHLKVTLAVDGWIVEWTSVRREGKPEHRRTGLASLEDCALAILQREQQLDAGTKIIVPWSAAEDNRFYKATTRGVTIYIVRANACGEVVFRSDRPHWYQAVGHGFWSWSTPPAFLDRVSDLELVACVRPPVQATSLQRLAEQHEAGART